MPQSRAWAQAATRPHDSYDPHRSPDRSSLGTPSAGFNLCTIRPDCQGSFGGLHAAGFVPFEQCSPGWPHRQTMFECMLDDRAVNADNWRAAWQGCGTAFAALRDVL
jgi:hypothetical protein